MNYKGLSKEELLRKISDMEEELKVFKKTDKLKEVHFESLFKSLTVAVALHEIILDEKNNPIDFIFLDVNPEYERITHLKAEEIIGKRGLEVIPGIEHYWIDAYGKVALTGEPITIIDHSKYLDKYWEVKAFSPKTNQFAVVLKDITDKKTIELALRESEERYKLANSASDVGIWDWWTHSDEVFYSGQWKAQVGYAANELENKFSTWENLLHPDCKQRMLKRVQNFLDNPTDYFIEEFRLMHKDGTPRWIRNKAAAVLDANGKVIRMFGAHTNITEQKLAEEALKESEREYRGLFEGAHDAIIIFNPEDEKILEANGQACKMHGFEYEEFIGMSLKRISKNIKNGESNIKETLRKGFNHQFETTQYHKDGSEICLEINASVIQYNGQIAILSNNRDITKRKEIETELKNKNKEYLALNKELKESLRQIKRINYELENAKEKAEESGRLKSAFLANMSHEIRTPMNGIIGFSEMFLRPGIGQEKRNFYAQIVIDSGKQLLNIVNDILDISMIESNTVKLAETEVVINELINELFAFYKPQFDNTDTKFHIYKSLNDNESVVKTDKQRLKQIISNLMNNAIKFTQVGYIKLGYELKGNNLIFYVEDTGIGIPQKEQNKIFERFRQLDMDNTRLYGGTGLGLSISKKLIELLGGKIWVESKKNKGSKFYFTIPYDPVKRAKPGIKEQHETNKKEAFTILVAEDEETNYLYIEEVLSGMNLKLIASKNGVETIRICKENPSIGLILMDLKMPILDGYEATKEIKKFRPELPIIAQTAYAMESDMEKAEKAGCNGYLSKPIQAEELIKIISGYINKK